MDYVSNAEVAKQYFDMSEWDEIKNKWLVTHPDPQEWVYVSHKKDDFFAVTHKLIMSEIKFTVDIFNIFSNEYPEVYRNKRTTIVLPYLPKKYWLFDVEPIYIHRYLCQSGDMLYVNNVPMPVIIEIEKLYGLDHCPFH